MIRTDNKKRFRGPMKTFSYQSKREKNLYAETKVDVDLSLLI